MFNISSAICYITVAMKFIALLSNSVLACSTFAAPLKKRNYESKFVNPEKVLHLTQLIGYNSPVDAGANSELSKRVIIEGDVRELFSYHLFHFQLN
jgi:hypothetical protein